MSKLPNNSTQLKSRFLKAALLVLAVVLAALCALFSPVKAQSVQPMVRNMPFPFRSGVAMDSALYASLKAKLVAADNLRYSSRRAIDSLQVEIRLTRKALDDQFILNRYDAHKADSLTVHMQVLQSTLSHAQAQLKTADAQFTVLLGQLPRRIRKALVNPTPEQTAGAVADYIHTLQARKWKWAGCSALLSGTLTVLAILLH